MQTRNFTWLLWVLMLSCTSNPDESYLKVQLEEKTQQEEYVLISLICSDTVLLRDFRTELSKAIADWRQEYGTQFSVEFDTAYQFFSQAHVKHLHDQRLAIEDLRDSISLIYEHANSFVNEQSISGQYLDELSTLYGTLQELKMVSNEIVFFTISHKYAGANPYDTLTEKLFYFPNDSIFISHDPALDPVGTYNLHRFVQHLTY